MGITPVKDEIEWTGAGWRIWRVERRTFGGPPLLRNPWANSGQTYWWEPGRVEVAECFWLEGVSVGWLGKAPRRCGGYVSVRCTCGIRSMDTIACLAAFLATDRQLDRHPEKAAVVGRVRFGGRVEHRNPGLRPPEGYNRSEFAELIGPLFVSPMAASHADGLRRTYRGCAEVVPPDATPAGSAQRQQEWVEQLAAWAPIGAWWDEVMIQPGRLA